jgi:hypothetical protein
MEDGPRAGNQIATILKIVFFSNISMRSVQLTFIIVSNNTDGN